MADTSISNLNSISTLADADLFVAVDDTDTTTKNLTATVLLAYIQGGTNLQDLADVATGTPADGQVLTYDTASTSFVFSTPSVGATTLDGLSDVSATSPSDNQFLRYDTASTAWVAESVTIPDSLSDLSDVSTTAPTDGQVLTYDTASGLWEPADSVSGATDLNALNDVVISGTPAEGEVLVYSTADTAFVNQAPDLSVTINTQTGTSYTLVLGDAGSIVEMNNAGANTLIIPTNASVAFTVGTIVNVSQYGTGTTTIDATTGVALNGVSGGSGAMDGQYDGVTLYKRATDEWIVQGAIGTVS